MKHLISASSLVLTLFLITSTIQAQEIPLSNSKGKSHLGMGVGLSYGTIGFRFSNNIKDYLSVFGGLGYHFAGMGYNVGLTKTFKSNSATQLYLTGMYGTNAAIRVRGLSEFNEVYRGATVGLGAKVNMKKNKGNYWDFGLLVPFTSDQFRDDENTVENDARVDNFTSSWPVLITLGYHFLIRKL